MTYKAPTIDIFWEGFDAYKDGKDLKDNPYGAHPNAAIWREGWFAGDNDTQLNEEDERPY